TTTVAAPGSNEIRFMAPTSITKPFSTREKPQAWWPPPRIDTGSCASRAKRTAAATSSVPAHWAMAAGLVRTRLLNNARAPSYEGSKGVTIVPEKVSRSRERSRGMYPVLHERASALPARPRRLTGHEAGHHRRGRVPRLARARAGPRAG